jgi:hypothetical protein
MLVQPGTCIRTRFYIRQLDYLLIDGAMVNSRAGYVTSMLPVF